MKKKKKTKKEQPKIFSSEGKESERLHFACARYLKSRGYAVFVTGPCFVQQVDPNYEFRRPART